MRVVATPMPRSKAFHYCLPVCLRRCVSLLCGTFPTYPKFRGAFQVSGPLNTPRCLSSSSVHPAQLVGDGVSLMQECLGALSVGGRHPNARRVGKQLVQCYFDTALYFVRLAADAR